MTISIALKVGDGVVLGTDSASALMDTDGSPFKTYASAEKVLNLVPGLPLGMLVFGVGGMENRSVMSLARDLRHELSSPDSPRQLDPSRYQVEEVADAVWQFFRSRYHAAFGHSEDPPRMGFILAGYSAGAKSGEIWMLPISRSDGSPREMFGRAARSGLLWDGDAAALVRLLHGAASEIYGRLAGLGLAPDVIYSALDAALPLWHPEMPVQEAIDLVRYLCEVVVGFSRFSKGIPRVAPPIDLAAITLHDGFRWISRKRWYDPALNPGIVRIVSPQQEVAR